MEELRKVLLQPENIRYYVITNLKSLPKNPHQSWLEHHFKNASNVLNW